MKLHIHVHACDIELILRDYGLPPGCDVCEYYKSSTHVLKMYFNFAAITSKQSLCEFISISRRLKKVKLIVILCTMFGQNVVLIHLSIAH